MKNYAVCDCVTRVCDKGTVLLSPCDKGTVLLSRLSHLTDKLRGQKNRPFDILKVSKAK